MIRFPPVVEVRQFETAWGRKDRPESAFYAPCQARVVLTRLPDAIYLTCCHGMVNGMNIVEMNWATVVRAAIIRADFHRRIPFAGASMHTVDALEQSIEFAQRLGYRIRQEWLGGSGGGACEFNGQKWLFVDLALNAAEQLEQVVTALKEDP